MASEADQAKAESAQAAANADQASSRPMALITLEQRSALIEYLAKQPYQEVANGIKFLTNAPIVTVNFTDNSSSDSVQSQD